MSELKLPVKFDEDFDLVDADGFPLLWGADMIDHNPDIGIEIAKRVNNHERLVNALGDCCEVLEYEHAQSEEARQARALLAELGAGEGGEV